MLSTLSNLVNAVFADGTLTLDPSDGVGISFFAISMALIAATAFFFLETQRVEGKWKTSLTVSGLVTLVAAVHYFYMRDYWMAKGEAPTVFRYIDWLITVPLLMVEFYLILAAIAKVPAGVFWRLMIGTLVMLVGGYLGEVGAMGVWPGFLIGMGGWAFILYEIFAGQASKINADAAPPAVQSAFKLMRNIVTFGWAIYPIGYFVGYLMGGEPAEDASAEAIKAAAEAAASKEQMLNVIYNIADVINKIAFGVIIWTVATSQSDAKEG